MNRYSPTEQHLTEIDLEILANASAPEDDPWTTEDLRKSPLHKKFTEKYQKFRKKELTQEVCCYYFNNSYSPCRNRFGNMDVELSNRMLNRNLWGKGMGGNPNLATFMMRIDLFFLFHNLKKIKLNAYWLQRDSSMLYGQLEEWKKELYDMRVWRRGVMKGLMPRISFNRTNHQIRLLNWLINLDISFQPKSVKEWTWHDTIALLKWVVQRQHAVPNWEFNRDELSLARQTVLKRFDPSVVRKQFGRWGYIEVMRKRRGNRR